MIHGYIIDEIKNEMIDLIATMKEEEMYKPPKNNRRWLDHA